MLENNNSSCIGNSGGRGTSLDWRGLVSQQSNKCSAIAGRAMEGINLLRRQQSESTIV